MVLREPDATDAENNAQIKYDFQTYRLLFFFFPAKDIQD